MRNKHKRTIPTRTRAILALVLVLALLASLLVGCGSFGLTPEDFDVYCQALSVALLRGDGLSVNILLDNPAALQLENEPMRLFSPTLVRSEYEAGYSDIENIIKTIKRFPYDKLSDAQKLTYNLIVNYFEQHMAEKDYFYFQSYLGGVRGQNVNVPNYLDRIAFKTEGDIQNYFNYMKSAKDAFSAYVDMEELRLGSGMGRALAIYEGVVDQALGFLTMTEDGEHYLISEFLRKLQKSTLDLTSEKVELLVGQNKKAVQELLAAYQTLAEEMNSLLALYGEGLESKGLAAYYGGADYYQLKLNNATATKTSVQQVELDLERDMLSLLLEMQARHQAIEARGGNQLELRNQLASLNEFSKTAANNIIASLSTTVLAERFPALKPEVPTGTVQFLLDAQQNDRVAGYYFMSALDNMAADEIIYVSGSEAIQRNMMLYQLLSHEGYPGHLYQHAYFKGTSPALIRLLLDGGVGMSEGWAVYSEFMASPYFANTLLPNGTETEKANLNDIYHIYLLEERVGSIFISLVDIQVNGYGKSEAEAYQWALQKSIYQGLSEQQFHYYFNRVLEVPASDIAYAYGFYKMRDAKAKYLAAGKTEAEFHESVLNTGTLTYEQLYAALGIA